MKEEGWAWLGGVRFLLASIVVTTHLDICSDPLSPICRLNHLCGFNAVLCFFLISGYSIAHSIRRRPKGFYFRRFLRIYPLYFLSLLLALVPWIGTGSILRYDGILLSPPSWKEIAGNFLLLQSFFFHALSTDSPVWSLSIEVFYYLLAPLLLRLRPLFLWLLFLFSATLYKIGGYSDYQGLVGLIPAVCLSWAWLLGWLYESEKGPQGSQSVFFSILFIGFTGYSITGGPPLLLSPHLLAWALPYAIAGFVVIAPWIRLPTLLSHLLNYLGELSYPWYVVHVPIFFLVRVFTPLSNPWICLILSLGASSLLLHGIDFPLRMSKKHLKGINA